MGLRVAHDLREPNVYQSGFDHENPPSYRGFGPCTKRMRLQADAAARRG